jgi:hypothetical protein
MYVSIYVCSHDIVNDLEKNQALSLNKVSSDRGPVGIGYYRVLKNDYRL